MLTSQLTEFSSVGVWATPSPSSYLGDTTMEQSVTFLINGGIYSIERTQWIQATIEKIMIINDIIPATFY